MGLHKEKRFEIFFSFFLFHKLSRNVRKPAFAYAKAKTQISFAVTAKLISAFVFATQIVQSLYFLNTKFQTSSHIVWPYSLVCSGPGRNPRRPVFSQRGSFNRIVYAAVTKKRISLRMRRTIEIEICASIRENDMIGQGMAKEKLIPYECLRNVLQSLQICLRNGTNA